MKRCSKCKQEKDESEFYKNKSTKDGLGDQCKLCQRTSTRRWAKANPEVVKEKSRKWKKDNPNKVRNWGLKLNYGISFWDYDKLLEEQNGKCCICGKITKLSVDHDHNTGMIRGLLCKKCNAMLGFADDNPLILLNGIRYLESIKKI